MTPEQAASLFRELMQTPESELAYYARRSGLHNRPETADLAQARELLQALALALASEPGPNWGRVRSAWSGMRAIYGQLPTSSADPAPPVWVRELPQKPSLGDLAPGMQATEPPPQEPQRFVPVARPQYVVAPVIEPEPVAPPPPAPPPRRAPPPRKPTAPVATAPAAASTGAIATNVSSYAAFSAACATSPERAAQTLRDYGIADDAARRALDASWQDRFDEDPDLLAQWERLFAQFREQLRRRG